MAKVLVFYYSSYGHVEKPAHEIAAGAREAWASADMKRVPVPATMRRTRLSRLVELVVGCLGGLRR